jgi:hypothetical protein
MTLHFTYNQAFTKSTQGTKYFSQLLTFSTLLIDVGKNRKLQFLAVNSTGDVYNLNHIIECDDKLNTSFFAVNYGSDTTFNGFEFRNCRNNHPAGLGPMCFVIGSSVTITNCMFRNNTNFNSAGALQVHSYTNATIRNCVFDSNNVEGVTGGALIMSVVRVYYFFSHV